VSVEGIAMGIFIALTRYSRQKFILDPSFDGYQDYWQWFLAVCQKHRDSYHKYLRSLQEGKL
jgi:hypothetical protein